MTTESSGVSQVIAFGDSLSDIGQGYVDGNGPTAVAVMAEKLGLDLLPGRMASANLHASRCYAVSGAGSGSGGGGMIKSAMFGRGLLAQLSDFEEALQSLTLAIAEDCLVFIEIGLNDRHLSSDLVHANCEVAIAKLHGLGVRRFAIASLPELGTAFEEVARRLNPVLMEVLRQAQDMFGDAQFLWSNFGVWFDRIRAEPEHYGLDNVTDPCAPGRAIFGENPARMGDPELYFYYHPDHPSAAVHRLVGEQLAIELAAAFA